MDSGTQNDLSQKHPRSHTARSPRLSWVLISALGAALLGGCASGPSAAEKSESARLATARENLGLEETTRETAVPGAGDEPAAYFRFALTHQPNVAAAYYDWQAAVRAIPGARALPDPQLTFQADISNMVMSLMPGLMFDIMAPGKRAAMGAEATASAQVARRAYEAALVDTAAALRRAWIELVYLDETLVLRRERLAELDRALSYAKAEYATGSGMVTLEAQTRLLTQAAQLRSEIAGLEDQKNPVRLRFKAALGLRNQDADPAWPSRFLPEETLPSDDVLWTRLAQTNPQLGSMRAMVDMAVAQAALARRSRTPDFTAGLMVDLKADPLMYRPTATMTLPLWREKIASAIQSAEARRLAASARLDAERLAMASELAQMLFMLREADRMVRTIDTEALPNLEKAEESARASYQAGMSGLGMLTELSLMKNDMLQERLSALRERERALADIAGMLASEATLAGYVPSEKNP